MIRIAFALLLLAGASAAGAQAAAEPPRSPALSRVVGCRGVADVSERLSCYDREVAALEAAEARKDVVVVDREQLRKTRRTLFGLVLPNLSVFGNDDPNEEGVTSIETKITKISRNPYGRWIFDVEDGGRWIQSDSRELGRDPKVGQTVAIRQAAMGSFLANVDGQVAIRVQRIR
jgi:hypothetical protein